MNTQSIHSERLLRLRDVLHRTGMSRSALYMSSLISARVKIGPRAIAFPESAVDRWIDETVAASLTTHSSDE
jgi:prophage regulatory protein